ncbi:GPI inositol-deacylase C, putative [Actinidia rufa]|uniref:GPI inositol-deacylase C, putative n=1 Tax=Actinidia rufa TaxID=165716 RepID=A0A7J0FLS8_9ERIC|nr:GPI inositol-deacylase C, putative [Actinidia rufa]
MARIVSILACLLIVVMDIAAGILGIKAEAAQNQVKHMRLWLFECKDPSQEAFTLGVAAATLLALAHVLANLLGGCSICTQGEISKASPSRQCSLGCIGHWIGVAGYWDYVKQQVKNFMWLHTPSLLVSWRHFVLCSCSLMLNGYVGNGEMGEAQKVFDEMPCRYVISRSIMIDVYGKVSTKLVAYAWGVSLRDERKKIEDRYHGGFYGDEGMGTVRVNFTVQVIFCPFIYLVIAVDCCPLANLWHGQPRAY